jgi:hypothetical protein
MTASAPDPLPGPLWPPAPAAPAQVVREPIDDFGTPAFVVLSIQNVSSDAPVELDEFPVHGECGTNLS